MNKRTLTYLGCGLAVLLFFAVNMAGNATLRALRLDLTEDKVFTLDENSKAIARGIPEPINLYFYFSRKVTREIPAAIEYADSVLDLLREFERAADGGIRLTVVDPEPFSEEEDRAVEQGVQAMGGGADPIYFGLVGTNAMDAREVIPAFSMNPEKQRTLEYDVSKLIWTLAHPDKRKVGILTALQLEGGGGNPMMGQQGAPPWKILEQLGDFFDLEVLPSSTTELPADLGVLVVIHPRGFGDGTLWLIDQWALAGKPLVVFADPQCDADPGDSDPSNPMGRMMAQRSSNPESLFAAWGIEMVKNRIACDRELGLPQRVPTRDGRTQSVLPLVFVPRLGEANLDRNDPVTRLLGNLLLMSPGSLRKKAEATTTFTPLLRTSQSSQEVDSQYFQFRPDPEQLLATFVPGYEELTLAARVTGNVKSAFPLGKPGTSEPPAEGEAPKSAGLTESSAPLNAIVVADADMLHDNLWMQDIGMGLAITTSQNADFLRNAIESVGGGQELMGIRTRGKTTRPFERVLEIQRASDQEFLARQQDLERKLQDAQTRLNELQKAKGSSDELVTAEQRKEEEKVRDEWAQTRRDLRDVEHKRRAKIEGLGTRLKWINIALMPLLVSAAAVAMGSWRVKQRHQR